MLLNLLGVLCLKNSRAKGFSLAPFREKLCAKTKKFWRKYSRCFGARFCLFWAQDSGGYARKLSDIITLLKKMPSEESFSGGVGRWGILVACRRSTARRGERIDILRRRYPPPDGLIYLLIGKIFGCSSRARSLLYCSFVWEVFELLWRKKSIQPKIRNYHPIHD